MNHREFRASRRQDRAAAIGWIALGLVVASAFIFWPLVPWMVLALWTAGLMQRVHVPLARRLGNRPRIAAIATVALLVLLIVPVIVLLTLLVTDAVELVQRLVASERAQETLQQLVTGEHQAGGQPDLVALVMAQTERVWAIAREIAGTAAVAVIGLVVLIVGTYTFLIDGHHWYRWIERHAPISPRNLRRFTNAFNETGHGLFVGIVGAGLAQSIIATIFYLALGVPRPFALGFLTLCASVIPVLGTGIVWVPVAAGLALAGRPVAAAILVIAGIGVIGTIDNFVRPYFARRGHLQLPTYVVLVAMFGGIQIMGGWGLLIAPLTVRLAKEALSIRRDQKAPMRRANRELHDRVASVTASRAADRSYREH